MITAISHSSLQLRPTLLDSCEERELKIRDVSKKSTTKLKENPRIVLCVHRPTLLARSPHTLSRRRFSTREQSSMPSNRSILARLVPLALAFLFATTAQAQNIAPQLVGTWSTGNGAVLTGPVSLSFPRRFAVIFSVKDSPCFSVLGGEGLDWVCVASRSIRPSWIGKGGSRNYFRSATIDSDFDYSLTSLCRLSPTQSTNHSRIHRSLDCRSRSRILDSLSNRSLAGSPMVRLSPSLPPLALRAVGGASLPPRPCSKPSA